MPSFGIRPSKRPLRDRKAKSTFLSLNEELERAGFDARVEALCEPHYARGVGRPGLVPGIYFRMLLIGYFEGIDSQRGIAWRCQDSLALRQFLGLSIDQDAPDHSALTHIRRRLPLEVYEAVFAFVLAMVRERKLLRAKTLGIDATMLEANAAMKSIVRRSDGENWKGYLRRLAREAGVEEAREDELRRMDRGRKGKRAELCLAFHANRRRVRGDRGKRLTRRRGELVERASPTCARPAVAGGCGCGEPTTPTRSTC